MSVEGGRKRGGKGRGGGEERGKRGEEGEKRGEEGEKRGEEEECYHLKNIVSNITLTYSGCTHASFLPRGKEGLDPPYLDSLP